MTILNDTLLNALKTAKPKEVKYVASILERSIKKGISIYEAAKIEKYQPGTKVTFTDVHGTEHVGVVEKVMTKRIRLFDKTSKSIVNIYPQKLKAYVPRTYTPRTAKETVKAKVAPENRVKRKYTKKATAKVDLSPLMKKYGKENQAETNLPREKRKYVQKNVVIQ